MVTHFGTASTPLYSSVNSAQRGLLKTIFDANGSREAVCAALALPFPVPAAPPLVLDVAASDKSLAAADNADSASGSVVAAIVVDSDSEAQLPVVSSLVIEAPQSLNSAASEAPQSLASAAAPATGSAAAIEIQRILAATSPAPAPAGIVDCGSASQSEDEPAPFASDAPQSLNSAAAIADDSATANVARGNSSVPQRAVAALASSIGGGAASSHSDRSSQFSQRLRRVRDDKSDEMHIPVVRGGARKQHQIDFFQGLPNPIFDQEKDCFKNSIALLMRLQHVPTSVNLQSPNMSLCDINVVLNQGGYYLRELPLYFDENERKMFKPEMPTLLAEFLKIKFGVDLPWLHDSALDFSQVERCVSRVLVTTKNALPYLILNPFNNNGVPLHCVGLECRWNKAIVWDPANVNSFEFSLRTLNALCDGRWTLSFRRIWCIHARA